MKYYNSRYWEMMNDDDIEVQNRGDTAWVENANKYLEYFKTIRDKLPKGFLKVFEKNDWFHDFKIKNINISNTGKYTSLIEFDIERSPIMYKLTFTGVKSFVFNVPSTCNWLCGILTWGYVEFEFNTDSLWTIRILCDFDCEIELTFKRISIAKMK